MSEPRTPAEALRKMADAVQERAHSSERACISLSDADAPEFVVAMARGEADATRRIEAMLRTEAERLDALPGEELSNHEWGLIMVCLDDHDPSGNGPNAAMMLRNAGFVIVPKHGKRGTP